MRFPRKNCVETLWIEHFQSLHDREVINGRTFLDIIRHWHENFDEDKKKSAHIRIPQIKNISNETKEIVEFYSQIEMVKSYPWWLVVLKVHDVFDSRLSDSWCLVRHHSNFISAKNCNPNCIIESKIAN